MDGEYRDAVSAVLALDVDQFGRRLSDPSITAGIPGWHPRNESTDGAAEATDDEATDDSSATETGQEVDYRKRFEDTQAWATQQAQEAAELRHRLQAFETDDEEFKRLAALRGLELPDDEPEDELDADGIAALNRKYAALEEKVERQEAAAAEAAAAAEEARETARIDMEIDATFKRLGLEGDEFDEVRQAAFGAALTMPFVNKVPQVDKGLEHIEKVYAAKQQQWANTKKTTHRVSATGSAGERKPGPRTTEQRIEDAMARLAE